MILSKEHIDEAVNGTLNRKQCDLLLLNWPPPKNWKSKLLGKNFSENWYEEFKKLKKELPARSKKIRKKQVKIKRFLKEKGIKADPFYTSFAWLNLRMEALKIHGARCQCCGASRRQNGIVINVDHIKSRRLHPELELEIDNLQVLCNACNKGKGAIDQTDWR